MWLGLRFSDVQELVLEFEHTVTVQFTPAELMSFVTVALTLAGTPGVTGEGRLFVLIATEIGWETVTVVDADPVGSPTGAAFDVAVTTTAPDAVPAGTV